MLKYFFPLICVWSVNCFAQPQSLAEYNRTLLAKIATKTPLTAKEFKTLRIRLGTEVTSADELAYKGRELQKLLVYSSLITYQNKNKAEENFVQEMWNKYLELPNTTNTAFETQYVADALGTNKKNKNLGPHIQANEYILSRYSPKSDKKMFFYPILRERCELLAYRRKTAELQACWEEEKEFTNNSVHSQLVINREKLSYYYLSLETSGELMATFDNILKDENLKPLRPFTKMLVIGHKIRDNDPDFKALVTELENLRRTDSDTNLVDKFLTILYLRENKIEKALDSFKNIHEANVHSTSGIRFYNLIASELYYAKGEHKKSLFYINKLIETEDFLFDSVQHYFRKQVLGILLKTKPTSVEVRKQLDQFDQQLTELQIDDPLTKAVMKTSRLLAEENNVNMAELKQSVADLKKYFYAKSFVLMMAERAVAFREEALEAQAVEKKAAAAAANKPVKTPQPPKPETKPEIQK